MEIPKELFRPAAAVAAAPAPHTAAIRHDYSAKRSSMGVSIPETEAPSSSSFCTHHWSTQAAGRILTCDYNSSPSPSPSSSPAAVALIEEPRLTANASYHTMSFTNPSKRGQTRRRPRPRAFATAAAAVSVGLAASAPLSFTEAAFSTSTFARRIRPAPSAARLVVRPEGGSTRAPSVPGTPVSLEDEPARPGLSDRRWCRQPSTTMSMYDLLERPRQSNIYALQGDSTLRLVNSPRLGSTSGRYGGLGSSPTSLSVSQSTNVLGFQVDDFESYNPSDDEDELKYVLEDFDHIHDDSSSGKDMGRPVIRTQNPRTATLTAQRVAASLLKNGSTTRLGRELANNVRSTQTPSKRQTNKSKSKARSELNLPWLPTESQINSLKVVELRAACAERGLVMTGRKADLQQRLLTWSTFQDHERVKERLTGLRDLIQKSKDNGAAMDAYDVGALTNKRKALRKEKKRSGRGKNSRGVLGLVDESYFNTNATGVVEVDEDDDEEDYDEMVEDNSMVNEASISQLSKTFNAPSSGFSNHEVREMYIEAKAADQAGDREKSKAILTNLREATPHDMRVVRRLARMEQEDGNLSKARAILQQGLQLEPDNAHLYQGLGQLERSAGNDYVAKKYFRQAIKGDPTFPNPYHALGTLEHSHGNIRAALAVIKEGIKHCPQNHRLHHALGDVYLDASMLDLAEESYLAGLQHAPHWGKSFFYTSLSYVSYAQGYTKDCRTLLQQSLEINGGMHAQGVIALAQLEESEGNIQQARKVYRNSVSRYEKKRRRRSPKRLERVNDVFDTSSLGDTEGNQYSRSYSGDKWINVFKSWARMEEVHGTYETAHIVYGKAARLFPNNVSLLIQWAELQAKHGDAEKARLLYEAACHRVGGRSAEPHRMFAEVEMRRKNFVEAQSILFRGVKAVAEIQSNDSKGVDLARLFHTWGVCEYHLGSLSRSELLFEKALCVTGSEEGDSAMRSLILYSMARLEFSRQEYLLAQHCIGLSIKENLLPGGNSLIWKLWSQIAEKMGNSQLLTRCKEQALLHWEEERGGTASDLSRLLGERDDGRLPERTGAAMKGMFRKSPWHNKVCPPSGRMDKSWHSGAKLWEL